MGMQGLYKDGREDPELHAFLFFRPGVHRSLGAGEQSAVHAGLSQHHLYGGGHLLLGQPGRQTADTPHCVSGLWVHSTWDACDDGGWQTVVGTSLYRDSFTARPHFVHVVYSASKAKDLVI